MEDGVALRGRGGFPSRWMLVAALLVLALGAVLYGGLSGGRSPVARVGVRSRGLSREGLLSLPLAAQGPVSAALGADSAAYRVSKYGGGFRAASPAQHLSASFTSSGVSVSSGATHLGLSVRGVGYGSSLTALSSVAPGVDANRVQYARPGLSEWYASGPLGLEQGFTIARPPAGHAAGPLTLSIALSGNTRASLAKGGPGITLSRAGKTVLRYTGLSATDARGHLLRSWLALERGRLLLRVDANGARYPLRIDPFIQQGEKLTAFTGENGQSKFGWSVALSAEGDTALVGAPRDDGFAGAAWVFVRSGSTWEQQGPKLIGEEPGLEVGKEECEEPGEEVSECGFGASVALSADGDIALIGAPRGNGERGAAWVFTRSGSTWTANGDKLTAGPEEQGEGHFGRGVALSSEGTTALIGAPLNKGGRGAAWVFTRSGSSWIQGEVLTAGADETAEGHFGRSVALSADGNTALIGAPRDSHKVGAVWAFTRAGSTWSAGEELTGTHDEGDGRFGYSVALSGDGSTALVGGNTDDGRLGAAWVFARSGAAWTQQGEKLTAGQSQTEPEEFGYSVALSGDGSLALIGDPRADANLGAAWVFTRSDETWTQQGTKLTGAGESGKGHFGDTVALSAEGNTALIGGPDDNEGIGAAWVFITPVPKFTIEKQQELAGEATYTNSELTAVIGQTVDYRITVANTGDVALEFSELNDPNCTGISPSGTRTIGAGESQTYTCHHELTASGSYSNQASIEGNEGTGTESSNTVAVTVVRAICTGNSGTVTLAPGLTNTTAVQRMKIKGTLTGCRGDTFTGATYTATLTTEGPVSCSVLKEAGEPDSGPAKYKSTPKTKMTKGTLSLRLTETPEVALSGALESGPYSPLTLSGTVTESYTGGSTCGEKLGKKAAKAVKKGTFSGSTVYFVE
jgi:FG-GAP repeat